VNPGLEACGECARGRDGGAAG